MTIAELFVNLGVKGTEKATKEVGNVKNSLGDVASSGLAAKAAIVGVIYGLERLMSQSAKTGTSIAQFSAFTGISGETLQRWQYAARQAGESSDELMGNIKSVQAAMTSMLTGHGAPEGMAMLANKVGFDTSKARDTIYVMQKLQEYANATKNTPDLANRVMASFGLSEGTIAAMRRNSFTAANLAKAPIYSDKESAQLNKVDVAWSNLGQKIQMAVGHLTAKHGMTLVNDVSQLANAFLKCVDAVTTLVEKLKLLQVLGKVFEGWTLIFNAIGKGTQSLLGNANEKNIKNWKGLKKDPVSMLSDWIGDKIVSPTPAYAHGGNKTINNNISQNLHFQHDGKDHARTGHEVKRAVQGALRQMPAQNQGA